MAHLSLSPVAMCYEKGKDQEGGSVCVCTQSPKIHCHAGTIPYVPCQLLSNL